MDLLVTFVLFALSTVGVLGLCYFTCNAAVNR